jgi:hypothetical protein
MAWGGFPYFEQLIKKQIDQLQDFILKYLHHHTVQAFCLIECLMSVEFTSFHVQA